MRRGTKGRRYMSKPKPAGIECSKAPCLSVETSKSRTHECLHEFQAEQPSKRKRYSRFTGLGAPAGLRPAAVHGGWSLREGTVKSCSELKNSEALLDMSVKPPASFNAVWSLMAEKVFLCGCERRVVRDGEPALEPQAKPVHANVKSGWWFVQNDPGGGSSVELLSNP